MSSGEIETTRQRILATTWRLLVDGRRGQIARMGDIATAAGLSRQALYLHFGSRTELLVATTRYGDEVLGLPARLRAYDAATGVAKLDAFIDFWGHYLPEIYGIARALLAARETDEAAAAAWDDRMAAVRDGCRNAIEAVEGAGHLAPPWSREAAIDLLWAMLSVHGWEQLTIERGWTTEEYIARMRALARGAFVRGVTRGA